MLLRRARVRSPTTPCARFNGPSRFVGDNCVEATPVPIPNTAVKLYSADGTAGAARWESTSSPTSCREAPGRSGPGAFSFFLQARTNLGEPRQRLLESTHGRIDVAQLVESEETDAEGLEVLGLVAP